jgi:hypothetical protein
MGRRERGLDGWMFVHIERIGLVATGERGFVRMPADRKGALLRKMPEWDVVGWAHTHPNFGIFFSGTDHQNCADFGPNGVNLVVDPIADSIGVAVFTEFKWQGSVPELVGRYCLGKSDCPPPPIPVSPLPAPLPIVFGPPPPPLSALPAPLPIVFNSLPPMQPVATEPLDSEQPKVVKSLPVTVGGSVSASRYVLSAALAFLAGALSILVVNRLGILESTRPPYPSTQSSITDSKATSADQIVDQMAAIDAVSASPDADNLQGAPPAETSDPVQYCDVGTTQVGASDQRSTVTITPQAPASDLPIGASPPVAKPKAQAGSVNRTITAEKNVEVDEQTSVKVPEPSSGAATRLVGEDYITNQPSADNSAGSTTSTPAVTSLPARAATDVEVPSPPATPSLETPVAESPQTGKIPSVDAGSEVAGQTGTPTLPASGANGVGQGSSDGDETPDTTQTNHEK